MTKNVIKVDAETLKKVEAEINSKQLAEFTKGLTDKQKKVLSDTQNKVESVETNSISNETANLSIIKNISIDLKNVLPLDRFFEGTNFKSLKECDWSNALMLKFTNKVLIFMMGKNADEIQKDNPLYFRALRDNASSIILNLIYDVIKVDEDGNAFNNPIGRKPKAINFNFKKLQNKVENVEEFKTKFNKEGEDNKYISFNTFEAISRYQLLKVSDADPKTPLLQKLNAVNNFINAGNNFYSASQTSEEVEASKEAIFNLFQVAQNSDKFDVLFKALIDLTDDKTFEKFKAFIKSHENKSVKIKMYQAVKFDGAKVKYLQADNSEALVKQLKAL
tara:strand:- start:278 stop:1279 length:1002 start_codon:yes stop_codon:yes gene_type:complete